MTTFFKQHREYLLTGALGLVIFSLLNYMMLQMNYEVWTNPRLGVYSAFSNGWELSGFDNFTYMVITVFRPFYTVFRHPLLMYFIWPLSQLNILLKDYFNLNCSIMIVAAVWTLISTASWVILYRIFRKITVLPIGTSLILCVFYYSFAHVMLATFAPDHMILTMTLLLLTLYVSAKAAKQGRQMSAWKSLLLCFLATGVSTTNCVKIWIADILGIQGSHRTRRIITRSLLYIIPLGIIAGIYFYEESTMLKQETEFRDKIYRKMKLDEPEKYEKLQANRKKLDEKNSKRQAVNNKWFEYTDFSIPILPSIVENFFGEGLQLHEDHLLTNSNTEGHRPIIEHYRHWYNYAVEGIIICLFLFGLWCGRKERLMWMACGILAIDMSLHFGLRFALSDVYIMTAHWAFVIPIAIGYIFKRFRTATYILLPVISLLAIWLWMHNLPLIYNYIVY